MNELLVLSLLMHWPLHAYKIAKIANNILGPEEEISRGTLSTLLAKLEQSGLIAETAVATPFSSQRQARVLAITTAGRERFQYLMLDTFTRQGSYRRTFSIKALHLEFLPYEQQLFLVEHFITYCQHLIQSKQKQFEAYKNDRVKQEHVNNAFRQAALDLMQRKMEQWQSEVIWAESIRERIVSKRQQNADIS